MMKPEQPTISEEEQDTINEELDDADKLIQEEMGYNGYVLNTSVIMGM